MRALPEPLTVAARSRPGPMLGERLATRDNNLNLIRMVAASAVLVSHAWPIALGKGTPEPFEELTGYSLGHMAVLVFFSASGFLIASSFERRTDLYSFLRARFARLIPGLAVSLLLVALVMGPFVTSLPVAAYLTDSATWSFILRNVSLVKSQYDLPGVFTGNPYPAVEGSLWTLLYEVGCYLAVVAVGLAGLLARREVATVIIMGYVLVAAVASHYDFQTFYQLEQMLRLSQPFALGMLLYLWRSHVPLRLGLLAGLVALAWASSGTPVSGFFFIAAITYGTIYFAAQPDGMIREYNRLGDFSYGTYIYAFPVQGLAVWLFGAMTPLENILWAFPATLLLAMLSWHYVEKPALDWARRWSRTRA